MADRSGKRDKQEFVWRGLGLCLGLSRKPVVTLVAETAYPHLYRIKYPDGWTSTLANLTRAKDAAYGHARDSLGRQTCGGAHYSPEKAVA